MCIGGEPFGIRFQSHVNAEWIFKNLSCVCVKQCETSFSKLFSFSLKYTFFPRLVEERPNSPIFIEKRPMENHLELLYWLQLYRIQRVRWRAFATNFDVCRNASNAALNTKSRVCHVISVSSLSMCLFDVFQQLHIYIFWYCELQGIREEHTVYLPCKVKKN